MLSEKPKWAMAMLQKVTQGSFNPGVLSSANVATIRGHHDPRLTSLLTSYQQQRSEDPVQRAAQQLFEAGKVAFNLSCAACHEESGEGRIGLAPSLVGSRWLQRGDDLLVRILLHGKENPGRGFVMPPWRQLEDNQIAAILTYVRREFGNQPDAVSSQTVAGIRAATTDRQKAWTDAELDRLAAGPAAK
jgi:mono/diheme cytochrome c family protein